MEMRSPLSRVRGLGSAKEGPAHWWAQRVTGVALVPLSLWFVVSVIALVGADFAAYRGWLAEHGNVLFMVLFIIALFHHAQLGVAEVIEDYVHHEPVKVVSLVAVKFLAIILGVSCVLAVLRVTFGG